MFIRTLALLIGISSIPALAGPSVNLTGRTYVSDDNLVKIEFTSSTRVKMFEYGDLILDGFYDFWSGAGDLMFVREHQNDVAVYNLATNDKWEHIGVQSGNGSITLSQISSGLSCRDRSRDECTPPCAWVAGWPSFCGGGSR